MSNSPLVVYKQISRNRNSPRTSKIDTITIHCVVGQCSAESLGAWFSSPNCGGAANYGVDKDGRVGLYVDEGDRAWSSGGLDSNGKPILVNGISGSDNDHRAITIEVASDIEEPYAVTDKAINGLIALLVDICKRNGIPKLLWKGNKSLVGQVDKQNMTVHQWFANKSCPGTYLYDRHGYIADEVNKRLGVVDPPPKPNVLTIQVTIGETKYVLDGEVLDRDTIVYKDEAYFPAAWFARKLGFNADWDAATNTTTLTKKSG